MSESLLCIPLRSKKQGDWCAPPHHTFPAFLYLNGRTYDICESNKRPLFIAGEGNMQCF